MKRTILEASALALLGVGAALAQETAVSQPGLTAIEAIAERPSHAECHASTVVEAAPGRLVAAWFGGTEEGHPDVAIWLARKRGDRPWSTPVAVADGVASPAADGATANRYPTWNPVLFAPQPGRLLLFYKVGPSPREWWGAVRESKDGGRSWGPPTPMPEGFLGPIRNKPLLLADGVWLAGSSTETRKGKVGRTRDVWQVHFERSDDRGQSWQRSSPQPLGIPEDGQIQAIQPTLLRHRDGSIQALCRSQSGFVVETWSTDDGRTWSPLTATSLPNPNAAIDAVSLRDGRFVLVYNPLVRDRGRWVGSRRRLDVAVSDDGHTWRPALVLESDPQVEEGGAPPGEYSYPAVIEASDGRVHVTYTWRRRNIRHAVIDPTRLVPRDP